MMRILTAALLAAPVLLAAPGRAQAYGDGPCSYGYGCGGLCLNLFSRIHQHGPLFNYGPYYGYPPFEPQGPWDAYLHYHEPGAPGKVKGKVKEHNPHPLFNGGLGSLFHKHKGGAGDCGDGCSTCGGSGVATAPGIPHAQPSPAPAPTTAYNPYQVNPYQGNPYAASGGYGYGYNPYAAAANAYYGPPMTRPMPYQPGAVPAGVQYR
jgi:hypothetical protein